VNGVRHKFLHEVERCLKPHRSSYDQEIDKLQSRDIQWTITSETNRRNICPKLERLAAFPRSSDDDNDHISHVVPRFPGSLVSAYVETDLAIIGNPSKESTPLPCCCFMSFYNSLQFVLVRGAVS